MNAGNFKGGMRVKTTGTRDLRAGLVKVTGVGCRPGRHTSWELQCQEMEVVVCPEDSQDISFLVTSACSPLMQSLRPQLMCE